MKLTVIYVSANKLILIRILLVLVIFIASFQLYELIITGEALGRGKYIAWGMAYIASFFKILCLLLVATFYVLVIRLSNNDLRT
ncbi:hypothetical protein A9264_03150 [Vibrio sp. UCD-FRSSP16_10]|nr:hypothetical protein A9260_04600 [Vibrio sp. UCD-FRSSP16_30]OBT20481.1 hypothetical protein A9264_03150 [Vibrio sp. UCD-FRSSP16_10]